MTSQNHPKDLKSTALVLMMFTLLSMSLIVFHPTVGADGVDEKIAEIVQEAALNQGVHGLLILCTLVFFACCQHGLKALFGNSLLFSLSSVAFLFGSLSMSGAALVNGFIFPNAVIWLSTELTLSHEAFTLLSSFSWNSNQALAYAGAIGWLLGIAGWSILAGFGQVKYLLMSSTGMVLSVLNLALFLTGTVHLNLHGAIFLLFSCCIWLLVVVHVLWRKQ
ncbi:hypothetical protein OAP14_05435 [Aliiglaciecola sp.]|nr:hypothetical protein [Aliiglaciecola sp.]